MTAWITMSSRMLARACSIAALAGLIACSSPEPATPPPTPKDEHPLERGTSEELSPPLGKPRPKLVPGDVLERESAAEKKAEPRAEDPEPRAD